MWIEVIKFYRECSKRAFSGKFFLIEKWAGGLGLLAGLATRFLPLPAGMDIMVEEDLPFYFFLALFVGTVFLGFITAPYTMYKEEREKRFILEKAREPKLKVYIGDAEGTLQHTGSTSQTTGGNRQTYLYGSVSNGLSLVVKNIGEKRAKHCIATLLWVERIDGERKGSFELFEPIALPWNHIDTESNLQTSIEAGASKRIWIADVNYRGWAWIMRDPNMLPADYQQIFGPSGRYRAIVQVSDGDSLSIQTKIEITCGESEPDKVHPSGTGLATISILEQESPRLPPQGTES